MAINGAGQLEQCMGVIRELSDAVKQARRSWINNETCVVNRKQLENGMDILLGNLPDVMVHAENIVRDDNIIRAQAAQDCQEALTDAQNKAQGMIADAQQQLQQAQVELQNARATAEQIIADAQRQATDEANRIIAQANQEAANIVAKGEAERDELVSQENVYRVATVEAEELRENTRKEMGMVRQNTFDYLDNIMGEVDRCLNSLVNDLRMERAELNNHR